MEIILVLVIAAVVWWFWQQKQDAETPAPGTVEVAPEPLPNPAVTRSGQTIVSNALGRSNEINAGKEGTIFEIPQHRLIDIEGRMVYKRLSEPSSDVRVQFEALRAFLAARSPDAYERLLRSTAWPLQLTEDGGISNGFVMRRATDQFRVSITGPKGPRTMLAEMPYLASDDSYLTRLKVTPLPTTPDRIAVLAELADVLAILHEGGAVYGDLSLVNTAYSVRPAGVFLLDCDSIRVPGSPTMHQLSAIDYLPPREEEPPTAATDVYKFACLSRDVLAQPLHARTLVDPLERATQRMPGPDGELLLRRSLLVEPADRPSMREWADFFSPAKPLPPPPGARLEPQHPPPQPGSRHGWVKNAQGEWVKSGTSAEAEAADHDDRPDEPAETGGWVRDAATGTWHRKGPDG